MEFINKLVDLAPPGMRQAILSIAVGLAISGYAEYKAQSASSALLDLHAACTKAFSDAAAIGLPLHADSRLDGELVTILPPTVEERRKMLKAFEKMRGVLIGARNLPGTSSDQEGRVDVVSQSFNDAQDKYLKWCHCQDAFEPYRKWSWLAYLACGISALWGFTRWLRTRMQKPKPQSRIVIPV